MAAGLVTVAHRSGGPLADIVPAGAGFLAAEPAEYARALLEALALQPHERDDIIATARSYSLITTIFTNNFSTK